MIEKTEWEVVDTPSQAQGQQGQDQRTDRPHLLKMLLGRRWRWKVAGAAVAASLTLVLVALLTSMFVVAMTAGALLTVGMAKVRQWWRRGQGSVPMKKY